MDRLDLEDIADMMVDSVQFTGYAVKHNVEDAEALRRMIRQAARARGLHIRTGVANSDPMTVWAARRQDELEFAHPTTEVDVLARAFGSDANLNQRVGGFDSLAAHQKA